MDVPETETPTPAIVLPDGVTAAALPVKETPETEIPTVVMPQGVTAEALGALVLVKYNYRKTLDLYVCINGEPALCCQCEATFPIEELPAHVDSHNRRKRRDKSA